MWAPKHMLGVQPFFCKLRMRGVESRRMSAGGGWMQGVLHAATCLHLRGMGQVLLPTSPGSS